MGSGVRLEPTWLLEPVLLFLHARPPTAAPAVAGCHLGQVGFVPGDNLLGGLPPYRPFLYFFLPFLLSSFIYFLMFSIRAENWGPMTTLRRLSSSCDPYLSSTLLVPIRGHTRPPDQNPPAGLGTTGPLGHPAGTQPTRAAPLGAGQRKANAKRTDDSKVGQYLASP